MQPQNAGTTLEQQIRQGFFRQF
jgi:hypothetical protein